jgi:hypothetical protein
MVAMEDCCDRWGTNLSEFVKGKISASESRHPSKKGRPPVSKGASRKSADHSGQNCRSGNLMRASARTPANAYAPIPTAIHFFADVFFAAACRASAAKALQTFACPDKCLLFRVRAVAFSNGSLPAIRPPGSCQHTRHSCGIWLTLLLLEDRGRLVPMASEAEEDVYDRFTARS